MLLAYPSKELLSEFNRICPEAGVGLWAAVPTGTPRAPVPDTDVTPDTGVIDAMTGVTSVGLVSTTNFVPVPV